jgi:beta-glucosidase
MKILSWWRRMLISAALLLVLLLTLATAYVFLSHPKLKHRGLFAADAAPGVFTFADIPRGRELADAEVDGFAERLLREMTFDEKVGQMTGDQWYPDLIAVVVKRRYNDTPVPSGENRRLRIPAVLFSDGPRGVVLNRSTAFPVAMARGASWDRALVARVAEAMASEIRAQGGNFWGGLCINLLRHPGWGRAQETFGEDPFLLGELAAASIQAVQRHNVMACAKHYALNSVEEERTKIDHRVDERTLREVYLPHFKRAVDAGAASVMSSYNKVNGEYAGENRFLLIDVLRRDWGFRGVVMSDFFSGIYDARKAALAGLDIEMPLARVFRRLPELVERGEVPLAAVDDAVRRILRTKIRFLTRPDPQTYDRALVASPAHATLAREAAEQGIVLLKNDASLLPLARQALRSVAIVGRLAAARNQGDRGSSNVHPPRIVTPLQGLREALGDARVIHEPSDDPSRVGAAARGADAVVAFVGLDAKDEGEYIPQIGIGGDRRTLALRPGDLGVVKAAAAANPRTIVVLIGGSAITAEEWRHDVPAILMAYYPGMEGGHAIARVLLGDVNPSAKLTFTVPADPSWLPPFTPGAPSIEYGYYHGYTLAEKKRIEPAFAFGYGLSYTRFAYANLRLAADRLAAAGGAVEVSVDVTNVGNRAGHEVVQLYVGFPESGVDRPRKLLRGFEKVPLAAGETRTVTFRVPTSDLGYWDSAAEAWRVEPVRHEVYVGGSSRQSDLLVASFTIVP